LLANSISDGTLLGTDEKGTDMNSNN